MNEYQKIKTGELFTMIYLIQEWHNIIKNYDASAISSTYIETEDSLIHVSTVISGNPADLTPAEKINLKSHATTLSKKFARHAKVRLNQAGEIVKTNGEGRSFQPIAIINV